MIMILGAATVILLCFLPSQVNGLLTAKAKCLPGYEWMFSSIGESPCDIALELISVCNGPSNLDPFRVTTTNDFNVGYYQYFGITTANQNSCRCTTVLYALLSACVYCQVQVSRAYYPSWSTYSTNCANVWYQALPEQIPAGVKVPAYAYLNVLLKNDFDPNDAYSMRGTESSRAATPTSTLTSTPSTAANTSTKNRSNNTPAIVGGVVGGVIGIGIIIAVIRYLEIRSRHKSLSQDYNSTLQSPNMALTPDTTASLFQSMPASPAIYDSNNASTNADHLNQNVTPSIFTESGARYSVSPQIPENVLGDNRGRYTGKPEV